jgi:hypothetical protein
MSAAMPGSVIVGAGEGEGEGEGEGDGEGLGFACAPPEPDLLEPPAAAIFEAPHSRDSGVAPKSESAPSFSHWPLPEETTDAFWLKCLSIEERLFQFDM